MNTYFRIPFLFALLSATFLFSFSPAPLLEEGGEKAKWSSYASPRGKFKAKFPSRPEITDEAKEYGTIHKAMSEFGESVYFTSWTDIKDSDAMSSSEAAETALESFTASAGGTLQNREEWWIKGFSGIKAEVVSQEQGYLLQYRVLFRDGILYQVVAAGPLNNFDKKTTKKFFKSFKMMK